MQTFAEAWNEFFVPSLNFLQTHYEPDDFMVAMISGEGYHGLGNAFSITPSGPILVGGRHSRESIVSDVMTTYVHEPQHHWRSRGLGHRGGWDLILEDLMKTAFRNLKHSPLEGCCSIPPNAYEIKDGTKRPGKEYHNRWEYCSCQCKVKY